MIPSFVNGGVTRILRWRLSSAYRATHIATQVNNRAKAHPAEIFLFVAAVCS